MIFGAIHNFICEPRSEIGRPAFVAFYGGSLNIRSAAATNAMHVAAWKGRMESTGKGQHLDEIQQ
jgi:hypothetical protein